MKSRTVRCHCGQLELSCEGEPRKTSMCHCLDCQWRTGSAFGVAVFYDRADVVVIRGGSSTFERPSASGSPVTFHFCSKCGSNVYWEPARQPEIVGVALGAFADTEFPPPVQSVWAKDKHPWMQLPRDLAVFDRSPQAISGGCS